jgi:protein TonB
VPVSIEKAEYPLAARRAGLEGAVILLLTIDAAGRVTEARVRRGIGLGCDEAARDALLRSRFEPGLDRSGRPVATRIRYRYNFVLE